MGDYDYDILMTLKEIKGVLMSMKQQEYDYWETWKKAKSNEQPKTDQVK